MSKNKTNPKKTKTGYAMEVIFNIAAAIAVGFLLDITVGKGRYGANGPIHGYKAPHQSEKKN